MIFLLDDAYFYNSCIMSLVIKTQHCFQKARCLFFTLDFKTKIVFCISNSILNYRVFFFSEMIHDSDSIFSLWIHQVSSLSSWMFQDGTMHPKVAICRSSLYTSIWGRTALHPPYLPTSGFCKPLPCLPSGFFTPALTCLTFLHKTAASSPLSF